MQLATVLALVALVVLVALHTEMALPEQAY
jgi:hypothetical protein